MRSNLNRRQPRSTSGPPTISSIRGSAVIFVFITGTAKTKSASGIQIVGHHHPAVTIRDGAGLRLKLPAFVQEDTNWIMPAFSPWAAGAEWTGSEQAIKWLCSPERVMKVTREVHRSLNAARVFRWRWRLRLSRTNLALQIRRPTESRPTVNSNGSECRSSRLCNAGSALP